MGSVNADGNNHISAFSYDFRGNATYDGTISYTYDAESQLKSATNNGTTTTYAYDGSGRRVSKSNGKLYWYGSGGEILAETDASGNTLNEYIFFGGKRIAILPSGGSAEYYVEDLLGSSRLMTTNNGTVCYDADFDPYGGEHAYTNTCSQNYKFEGKERDTETGNDDFGARYYTSRFGRWLSADWSNVPVPVPYANLTNPQTLNLYSMVADDPESFADLDGHVSNASMGLSQPGDSGGPTCAAAGAGGTGSAGSASCGAGQTANQTDDQQQAEAARQQAQNQAQNASQGQSAAQQRNGDIQSARQYLSGSSEMRTVMTAFDGGHFHIKIIHDGNDRYDPQTRTVYWDPHSALKTTAGGHQTPALGLGHEMAHATANRHQYAVLSNTADQRYNNKEDRRVIRNYENPAARELGESPRYNHGGTPYNVRCPTCQ